MSEQQSIGEEVKNWRAPTRPEAAVMQGRYCRVEPLDADAHAALLFQAVEGQDALFRYMYDGPFASAAQYHRWVRESTAKSDMQFFAIKDVETGRFGGVASYLRIAPEAGSIEVGNICFGPRLQNTRAATETMYLMMKWAFEAGYRRYEWKCNALNIASRRAAQRLGFTYEGVFRQAAVAKGRNRDTAWFAVIDKEWPALSEAFDFWLAPSNFDAQGRQKERLSDLTRLVRAGSDPAL